MWKGLFYRPMLTHLIGKMTNCLSFGKVRHNLRIESCLGCKEGALRAVLCTKSSILLAWTGVWKIGSVAYGFNSIKIDYSDYQKCLISRINDVYVWTSFITDCFAAIILVVVCKWFLWLQHHVIQRQRHLITRIIKADPQCTSMVWFHWISLNWQAQAFLIDCLSEPLLLLYTYISKKTRLSRGCAFGQNSLSPHCMLDVINTKTMCASQCVVLLVV